MCQKGAVFRDYEETVEPMGTIGKSAAPNTTTPVAHVRPHAESSN